MGEKKKNLLQSFIDYFYGNFVVLLLGFISLPLVTRLLDTEEFGKTAMFTTAVSVIYIFAILGLDQAYIRFFYKQKVNQTKLFIQCLIPSVCLVTILAILYVCGAPVLNQFLFGTTGTDITLLVLGYTVISVFERFLFLNIRMEQNGKLYSNLNILSKVLNILIIIVTAWMLGNNFRVVLYAMTGSLGIVTLLIGIRFIIRNRKTVNSVEEHAVTEKDLLSYGVPFVMMLLMEWLLSSMDKWSIKAFCGFGETGIYSSAMQIMTVLLTFKITFVAFWSPVAMEKYENVSEEESVPFFRDIFGKVQFLCITAAFLLTIFRSVIVLILGSRYRDAIRIIPYLSLMPVLSILFEMISQGIKFKGKIRYINYASITAICCNLIGNLLLVPIFKGIGAAFATAVTYIVYFLLGTYFAEKCYPVGYPIKKLLFSLILYMGYATYASFCDTELLSVMIGIVLLIFICFINRIVIKDLWSFVTAFCKGHRSQRQ